MFSVTIRSQKASKVTGLTRYPAMFIPYASNLSRSIVDVVNTTTGVKQYNVDMATALLTGLPTLLVYVLAGKYFVRGLTAGSVKG